MKLYITGMSIFVLLIFYLPIVLFILWRIVRSKGLGKIGKAIFIPIFLAIAYAIPLGDVTANSIAMAKVCPKAGLHVYKQVKVEGYFDPSGGEHTFGRGDYKFVEYTRPGEKISRLERQENGQIKRTILDKTTAEYEVVYEEAAYSKELVVKKKRYLVRNRQTQEVIGEWLEFGVVPGWLDKVLVIRWFGGSVGACGSEGGAASRFPFEILPARVSEQGEKP